GCAAGLGECLGSVGVCVVTCVCAPAASNFQSSTAFCGRLNCERQRSQIANSRYLYSRTSTRWDQLTVLGILSQPGPRLSDLAQEATDALAGLPDWCVLRKASVSGHACAAAAGL